jgi:hypothetical protein
MGEKKITGKRMLEFLELGNRAVENAQRQNWEKGMPNVYSKNKQIFFEYPDHTIKGESEQAIAENADGQSRSAPEESSGPR